MITIESKNKALDSLADAPMGSGIVLSAYGFAATMKAQQEEAEEKERERAKVKAKAAAAVAARPARPLVSKRPLPSRRQLLMLPPSNPAAASEGLEDGGCDGDAKENARRFSHDAHGGSYEGADDDEGGKDKDEDDDDDGADADAAPAAAGAWAMNMISNAASKFRVAGISRRRRLE